MTRRLLPLTLALTLSVCTPPERDAASIAPDTSASTAPVADSVTFAYTTLDYDACHTLAEYEHGMGVELRCPGYGGVPLYVTEGDLRMDVDAGVPNGVWTSLAPFNSLGETIEWRLRGDEPFALIARYHLDDGGGTPIPSRLAVLSIGREGDPGCLVGWVEAQASPDQNTAARTLADQEAEAFDCASATLLDRP